MPTRALSKYMGCSSMVSTTVVIMSRNRKSLLIDCLNSVINQTSSDYKIIISENSDADDTYHFIKDNYASVEIIRRPQLNALDHIKLVISECQTEYLTIFHDDDIMFPSYIEKMQGMLKNNPNYAAVSCNSNVMRKNIITKKRFFYHEDKVINDERELIRHYCTVGKNRPAAFPAYMYRSVNLMANDFHNKHFGKYSDVIMISNLLVSGKIYWSSECLIAYRIHQNNDSGAENIRDRQKLNNYFQSVLGIGRSHPMLQTFRSKYLLRIKYLSALNATSKKSYLKKYFRSSMFLIRKYLITRLSTTGGQNGV